MQVNIGLIGTGTIGSGVVEILKNNSDLIEKRTGVKINLKKVCEKDLEKAKKLLAELGLSNIEVTDNYKDLINDKDIQIIIELIGGYEPARTIILEAVKLKKGVVTANKAVIAKHGEELIKEAIKNNVTINFEAAVAGCIPIIKVLKESLISDKINSIYGILNGTTNYILTRMEEGMSYEDALKKAQELGFAEADPTFDVEGYDAAQKIQILSMIAYNSFIKENVPCFGISKIKKEDIVYAKELGYKIKLLATAKLENNQIDLRVQPTMIPSTHQLANVRNELNAIFTSGEQTKEIVFSGRGAGKLPTATVVVSDIIDIAKKKTDENTNYFNSLRLKNPDEIKGRFYIRFMLMDKPGTLAKIAKILGENNISINAVSQKEENAEDFVPVILITHKAVHKNIINALRQIRELDIVKEKPFYLMIEDF